MIQFHRQHARNPQYIYLSFHSKLYGLERLVILLTTALSKPVVDIKWKKKLYFRSCARVVLKVAAHRISENFLENCRG